MTKLNLTRRQALRSGVAAAGAIALGAPALAQNAPIKFGVLMPFSGGLELFGQQAMQGIEMLVDEVNGGGGVQGRMIEIIKADNRTDPKTSVERVQQLLRRDEVDAVIGPVTSSARDAITSAIERARKPLLYATDYEGGVCSDYISCYSALPAHYVDPLVPHLMETVGKRVYLFGSDYIWPQKMNEAIRASVTAAGGEVVGEEYAPFGVKDFATTIRKIEEAEADAVILTVPGADGVTFVKQFTAAGAKNRTRLAFMGFNENYLPGLTTAESDGIIGCAHFIQSLDRPDSQEFVARQKAKFGDGTVVSYYVDSHYGIARFFAEAMGRAESDDSAQIMAAMAGHPLTIGNGEVDVRADDLHVNLNMLIFEAGDNRLQIQNYIGRIEAPSQCS